MQRFKLNRSQLTLIAITATILLSAFFPTTRRLLLIILPLGNRIDDIIFWLVTVILGVVCFRQFVTIPRKDRIKQLALTKARMGLLKERIPLLIDYIDEWVGTDPTKGRLYAYSKSPEFALINAKAAQKITREAILLFSHVQNSSDPNDLPTLERIYIGLVGYTDPTVTWHELREKLNEASTQEDKPLAAIQLKQIRLRRESATNWEIVDTNTQIARRHLPTTLGALDYIFDTQQRKV